MKVKIKSIYINSTNKDGEQLQTSAGKPYKKAVLTSESGKKASFFIWQDLEPIYLPIIGLWKEGDTVDVKITKSGEYYNFEPINELQSIKERLAIIEQKLGLSENTGNLTHETPENALNRNITPNTASPEATDTPEKPIDDIDISNLPF